VIHLGGRAAVVVPDTDFLRLRALELKAFAEELKDAEDAAAALVFPSLIVRTWHHRPGRGHVRPDKETP
jgi:hypothetical protein